jgi:FAD/FMN-containing dehydrogenase/Fe-S oxidoreductase
MTSDQLADDLRNLVQGTIRADALSRGLRSTDASPFQLTPLLVVEPRDEADVIAIVKFADEHSVSVSARGAGTGLAGESLGDGIILDFSTHFRAIHTIADDRVTVEPGVTFAEVQAELARHGRRLAIDPSNEHATLGGLLATNGSGPNAFRHGYLSEHVDSLRVVWANGSVNTIPHEPWPAHEELRQLLVENRDTIQQTRPRTRFTRCGYALPSQTSSTGPDLIKLLVGSEGTLGLITAATVRTILLAGGVCQFNLGFATLESALRTASDFALCEGVVVCDVLDQRLLALTLDAKSSTSIGAAIAVRIEAETEALALTHARTALERIKAAHVCITLHEPTCEPEKLAQQRLFRESAIAGLYGLGRGRRPESFVEDVAVPVDAIPAYVSAVHDLLRSEELNASVLVHLLMGIVHTRPLLDLGDDADRERMWRLADKIHTLALALGGTISAQHGVGLARTPWIEKQSAPLLPVLREVKRLFDPKGILNPGKLIGLDPSRPAWPLRAKMKPLVPLLNLSTPPEAEALKCNGCGDCRPRTSSPSDAIRMCPIGRALGSEEASPRAKANLFRLLDDTTTLPNEDVGAVAKLCVNCKQCRSECRAKVDIPTLMLEVKAQHYAAEGLSRGEWLFARSESLLRIARHFATTVNFLLARRSVRWLLEKVYRLSRYRRIPRLAHRSFLHRAWWAGLTRRRRTAAKHKVVYFVDHFANIHDPQVGEATVAVLKHLGCEVVVPWRQRASGMTPLSFGDADTARELARANVRTLVEYVRDGYVIVCSEPTAAVALVQDYRFLLDDEDTLLVAKQTRELMTFLGELHAASELPSPTLPLPTTIGHHVPCHVKVLGRAAAPSLLQLIPDLQIHTLDEGCSGMAGVWGLSADHYVDSLAAGRSMIEAFDRPRILFGSSECSACRMQMEETTGKRTLHPIVYLAWAYGVLPNDALVHSSTT